MSDLHHMGHALRLAARGLGRTWPNPSVGALVVKDGVIAGAATTARGGRPHAETQALAMAGAKAKGATLYVTLEPCSHQGKTGPCAQAVIDAGIKRVVAACGDPNPKVSGEGFAMLERAGIEVVRGVCEQEARGVNEGFFSLQLRGRPFVALKTATSLDGKIADASGRSKWITGEQARRMGHALRATHDAILTGIGTALADDPELTCRLPGREADSPQRVLLDGNLRIGPEAKMLPAWIFTSAEALKKEAAKAKALQEKGARLFTVAQDEGALSLPQVLGMLAEEGVTRLLVEAGGTLSGAFLQAGLIDRLYWFRAPMVVGDGGTPAFKGAHGFSPESLPRREAMRFGEDMLEICDIEPV